MEQRRKTQNDKPKLIKRDSKTKKPNNQNNTIDTKSSREWRAINEGTKRNYI